MTKKPQLKTAETQPKGKVYLPNEAVDPPPTFSESWNRSWTVHRRMLEARKNIKKHQVWQTFNIHRDFEAFSIHKLANGVEEVLNELGVMSDWRIDKWEKSGNMTVVTGMWTCVNVDDPKDIYQIPCVGEGADGSDKGLNKAVSSARKLGMVSAFNLGVGYDVETDNQPAQGAPPQGPQPKPPGGNPGGNGGSAQPGPTPQKGNETSVPGNGAAHAPAGNGGGSPIKTYTMQFVHDKAKAVLSTGMVQQIWAVVQNAPTTDALSGWCEINKEMLEEFTTDFPDMSKQCQKLVQARFGSLKDKGV